MKSKSCGYLLVGLIPRLASRSVYFKLGFSCTPNILQVLGTKFIPMLRWVSHPCTCTAQEWKKSSWKALLCQDPRGHITKTGVTENYLNIVCFSTNPK
jgi:hypothetical protein